MQKLKVLLEEVQKHGKHSWIYVLVYNTFEATDKFLHQFADKNCHFLRKFNICMVVDEFLEIEESIFDGLAVILKQIWVILDNI